MADEVAGLEIKITGDTTGLEKAVDAAQKKIDGLDKQIKSMNEGGKKTNSNKNASSGSNTKETQKNIAPDVSKAESEVKTLTKSVAQLGDKGKKGLQDIAGAMSDFGGNVSTVGDAVSSVGNVMDVLGIDGKAKENAEKAGEAISTVGDMVESVGAAAAILPQLITPAGLAIAGVTAATAIGVSAYQSYRENIETVGDRAEEAGNHLRNIQAAFDEMQANSQEFEALSLKLNDDSLSEEEISQITNRMEELAQWFKEKYNVELTVSGADEVIKKNQEVLKGLQAIQDQNRRDETYHLIGTLQDDNNKSAFEKSKKETGSAKEEVDRYQSLKSQYQEVEKNARKYLGTLQALDAQGASSDDERRVEAAKELSKVYEGLPQEYENRQHLIDGLRNGQFVDAEMLYNHLEDFQGSEKEIDGKLGKAVDTYAKSSSQTEKYLAEVQTAQEGLMAQIREDTAAGKDTSGDEWIAADLAKDYGLDFNNYAQQIALAKSQQQDFNMVAQTGGDVLDNYIANYIEAGQKVGMSSQEMVRNAALMKEGFTSIDQAAQDGGLQKVFDNLKTFGSDLGMPAEEIEKLAQEMNLIPEGKKIEISAEGDISLVDEAEDKVDNLDGQEADVKISAEDETGSVIEDTEENVGDLDGQGADVTISAEDGASDVIAGTDQKVESLNGKSVSFSVSADGSQATATIDGVTYQVAAYDGASGNALLSADGAQASMVVNMTTGQITAVNSTKGTGMLDAIDNASQKAKDAASAISGLKSKTVTITTVFRQIGETVAGWFGGKQARGTQNFPGGLAMINDERGVSDPRELVEVGGKHYLFEGRDVVLPLPKHAKVYTAGQTKNMMNMAGIPRYAGGKNNAFDNWKDDWSHQQRIRDINPQGILEQWNVALNKFRGNTEAVKEIEEALFSATKNLWKQQTDDMDYALEMGKIDEAEYYNWLEDFRNEHYEVWTDDYKKATLKIKKYNDQLREDMNEASLSYLTERAYFNDWGERGDDPIQAYWRVASRNQEAVANGEMTDGEYNKIMSEVGKTMLDERISQSEKWIEWQKKFNDMSAQDERDAYQRILTYIEEYRAKGMISEREAHEAYMEFKEKEREADRRNAEEALKRQEKLEDRYERARDTYGDWEYFGDSKEGFIERKKQNRLHEYEQSEKTTEDREKLEDDLFKLELDRYQELEKQYDEFLDQQSEYINKLRNKFSKEEQALQDSWRVEDRKADKAEIAAQMELYKNSVTNTGMEKYKDLQKQYRDLQREEELYQLQTKNNAVIEKMEQDLESAEENKKIALKNIQNSGMKITGLIQDFTKNIQDAVKNDSYEHMADVFTQLVRKIDDIGNSTTVINQTNHINDKATGDIFRSGMMNLRN